MSKDVKVFLEYAGIILLILEDLEGLLAMLDIFWIGRYKICNIELNLILTDSFHCHIGTLDLVLWYYYY